MKFLGRTGEYFEILEMDQHVPGAVEAVDGQLSLIWFLEDDNVLEIDAAEYTFDKDQMIFLTSFNKAELKKTGRHRYLRFNSPFYCIVNHDSEVGCKGILFFGSKTFPFLAPDQEDLDMLNTVWKMLTEEMKNPDDLQLEMLQMMLKRLLILFTRIYKTKARFDEVDNQQVDIVREFSFLVEQHFKEKHSVSDYASLLNKSPKTLSNIFNKLYDKTPLQVIHNRIMLEVKRLLRYTDLPISEIGFGVGFNDLQSFSRFFKKNEGSSPTEFRLG